MMILAAGLASLAGVIGLYLSFYLSIASGAAIVLTATLFFLIAFGWKQITQK
jgi:manganese/iron transport system permease protein